MPAKGAERKNTKLRALSLPDQLDACPVNFRKQPTEISIKPYFTLIFQPERRHQMQL